jgi:hypothetical protein
MQCLRAIETLNRAKVVYVDAVHLTKSENFRLAKRLGATGIKMAETHFKVQVESDHIKRLTAARPVPALAELVWNSADADATRIDIEIDQNDFGMQAVTVRDDGHGLPHDEVEALFGKLGGSWKTHGNRSKIKGRILHGKEGKGRFKALALGRVANWSVIYREADKLLGYSITIIRDDLVDVRVSPKPC